MSLIIKSLFSNLRFWIKTKGYPVKILESVVLPEPHIVCYLALLLKGKFYSEWPDSFFSVCFRSLSPLFDNSKLDKELRNLIKLNFSEFCSPDGK